MAEEREMGFAKLRDDIPVSSKRSKMNEDDDRLSDLSDCLLLHILSFLPTKEVVKTCLLSKRWIFLWTYTSVFDLRESSTDITKISRFVDIVGRMLLMCSGNHLNKFSVNFWYEECFASNVNTWVHFAVKNKVKDITLHCLCRSCKQFYVLPQIFYTFSSMTSLSVKCCDMAPQGVLEWGSLKSLTIERVEFQEGVMEKIFSGCPVLEVLQLIQCMKLDHLDVCSRSLTTLVIKDCINKKYELECFIEIYAPYVRVLSIREFLIGSKVRLRNVSSVVRANLDFGWLIQKLPRIVTEMPGIVTDFMNLTQFNIESLESVKELELGPRCIEILSLLEVKGSKLSQSRRCYLTLNVGRHKESIPGVIGILKSSPNLETLLIRRKCDFCKTYVTWDQAEAYLKNGNLDIVASHLKTLNIIGFSESILSDEPMLKLVQLLLRKAKILEKMVIKVEEESIKTSSTNTTSANITKIYKTLLTFTRASPEAVIVVV